MQIEEARQNIRARADTRRFASAPMAVTDLKAASDF